MIRTALVIGAGVAGPTVALALRKAGIEPLLFEAHPGSADDVGVFLTLATNGIAAMRILDADRAALRPGFATPAITLRSHTGKRLGSTRTGGVLADGTVSHTLRRTDLYRGILDVARDRGVHVEHGKRLIDVEFRDEQVVARFDDGTRAEADVLIGCDGVHSTVRRLIDPAAPAPTYAGLLNTGGYAARVDVDARPGTYEMIFGKQAFFGYVLAPGGEVWWFANLPAREDAGVRELRAGDLRRHLCTLFSGDAGPATRILAATSDPMPLSPVRSVPQLPAWHRRRMIVIGDAAHAPTPSSGQGASLAVEDAVVLARCLRDAPDPSIAFRRFETERRKRVEHIIRAAARINASKTAGPVGRVIRDALFPPILKLAAGGKAQRRVYDHTVDWSARAPG